MAAICTQIELSHAHCTEPDCQYDGTGGVYLEARCHPRAGFKVFYLDGVLMLQCRACQTPVIRIAVAKGPLLTVPKELL